MSISLIIKVRDRSESRLSDRLVLLALADYANEEGEAWPSVKSLCRWANISERAVQESLRALMDAGEVQVEIGAGPRGCNLYHVTPGGADFAGVQTLRGADFAPGGAKSVVGGAKSVATPRKLCTQSVIDPSSNPPENPSVGEKPKREPKKPELTDEEWLLSLSQNPAYAGIDIARERGKAQAWCDANRRILSRQFFVNWLNRAEKPILPSAANTQQSASGRPTEEEAVANVRRTMPSIRNGGW